VDEDIEHVVGSRNVFADLGFENPEEELARAELAYKINCIISSRGWTQKRAAEVLGVDQPKVSALVRGRLSGFSIDRLTRFLNALDYDVTIEVSPKPAARAHARTSVVEPIAASAPDARDAERMSVS
jgi:predicted XRE-type DNA-binding protein